MEILLRPLAVLTPLKERAEDRGSSSSRPARSCGVRSSTSAVAICSSWSPSLPNGELIMGEGTIKSRYNTRRGTPSNSSSRSLLNWQLSSGAPLVQAQAPARPAVLDGGIPRWPVTLKAPSDAAFYGILQNPAYSGAFAYGCRPTASTCRMLRQ